jgi:DNA-binding NarL/FixJ family response regulator
MTRLRTFIVEDSAVMRESLTGALEELAEVDVVATANSERGALAWLAANNSSELLLLDVFLQSGSGLSVLSASVQLGRPRWRVVVTNYATPEMRAQCLKLGADRVFDKSHDIDSLVSYCRDLAHSLGRSSEASDKPW